MPNFVENVDTVVEEVLEDIIAAVVSDSSQIETTVQSVLRDIVAMEFGQLDTDADNVDCEDRRMVAIVDQLVDAMVHLVSEKLSSARHVQPGDASFEGKVVLRCVEEEEEEDLATGGDFEVVMDDEIPTEDEERIVSEVLDGETEVKPATRTRGRIRRLAAAAWRGVKRAGLAVILCR